MIAVVKFSFTLDALTLMPSGFCNVGVNPNLFLNFIRLHYSFYLKYSDDGKEYKKVNVKELAERFRLHVAAGQNALDREIQGGYCGDLLSDVMANAPSGCVWLTVQTHLNIVAVAVLHEMAAVVLTGGREPDRETVTKADEEGIPILVWPESAFALAGKIHAAGIDSPS